MVNFSFHLHWSFFLFDACSTFNWFYWFFFNLQKISSLLLLLKLLLPACAIFSKIELLLAGALFSFGGLIKMLAAAAQKVKRHTDLPSASDEATSVI